VRALIAGPVAMVLGLAACTGDASSTGQRAPTSSTSTRTTTAAPSSTLATPTTTPGGVHSVFARTSPWYRAVPADAPVGPAGFTYGQELAIEVVQGYRHASLNTQRYAPAVYEVPPGHPTVPVTVWNCQNKPSLDAGLGQQLAAVPLPADALVPPDSDAHVVVWQPSTDTVWEMWKTRRVYGQWQACWGGQLTSASTSTGTFAFPYGSTASGISLLAGLVTLDDLRAGKIDHALALGVGNTLAGSFSWPANRTDGRTAGANAIPEGQRLRLDPSVDVSTLRVTPLGRMIATALQRYGAIVRDTTVGAVTVYAENPLPLMTAGQPDPYQEFYAGTPKYAQLDGIPWERMVALPADYGRAGS
jgi:hypothetical protein